MYGSIIHRLNHLHKTDDARWLMTTYKIHCTITVSPADFMSDIHVWILEIWKGFRLPTNINAFATWLRRVFSDEFQTDASVKIYPTYNYKIFRTI